MKTCSNCKKKIPFYRFKLEYAREFFCCRGCFEEFIYKLDIESLFVYEFLDKLKNSKFK